MYFFSSSDDHGCQGLVDWYVDYDGVLEWCTDAEKKVEELGKPGEYIVIVERQHGEIGVNNIWL